MHRFESETECKEFCGNNQTCIGVYMASNGNESNTTSCWFQMPFEVSTEPEVLTTVTHWTLANCTGTISFLDVWLQLMLKVTPNLLSHAKSITIDLLSHAKSSTPNLLSHAKSITFNLLSNAKSITFNLIHTLSSFDSINQINQ